MRVKRVVLENNNAAEIIEIPFISFQAVEEKEEIDIENMRVFTARYNVFRGQTSYKVSIDMLLNARILSFFLKNISQYDSTNKYYYNIHSSLFAFNPEFVVYYEMWNGLKFKIDKAFLETLEISLPYGSKTVLKVSLVTSKPLEIQYALPNAQLFAEFMHYSSVSVFLEGTSIGLSTSDISLSYQRNIVNKDSINNVTISDFYIDKQKIKGKILILDKDYSALKYVIENETYTKKRLIINLSYENKTYTLTVPIKIVDVNLIDELAFELEFIGVADINHMSNSYIFDKLYMFSIQ